MGSHENSSGKLMRLYFTLDKVCAKLPRGSKVNVLVSMDDSVTTLAPAGRAQDNNYSMKYKMECQIAAAVDGSGNVATRRVILALNILDKAGEVSASGRIIVKPTDFTSRRMQIQPMQLDISSIEPNPIIFAAFYLGEDGAEPPSAFKSFETEIEPVKVDTRKRRRSSASEIEIPDKNTLLGNASASGSPSRRRHHGEESGTDASASATPRRHRRSVTPGETPPVEGGEKPADVADASASGSGRRRRRTLTPGENLNTESTEGTDASATPRRHRKSVTVIESPAQETPESPALEEASASGSGRRRRRSVNQEATPTAEEPASPAPEEASASGSGRRRRKSVTQETPPPAEEPPSPAPEDGSASGSGRRRRRSVNQETPPPTEEPKSPVPEDGSASGSGRRRRKSVNQETAPATEEPASPAPEDGSTSGSGRRRRRSQAPTEEKPEEKKEEPATEPEEKKEEPVPEPEPKKEEPVPEPEPKKEEPVPEPEPKKEEPVEQEQEKETPKEEVPVPEPEPEVKEPEVPHVEEEKPEPQAETTTGMNVKEPSSPSLEERDWKITQFPEVEEPSRTSYEYRMRKEKRKRKSMSTEVCTHVVQTMDKIGLVMENQIHMMAMWLGIDPSLLNIDALKMSPAVITDLELVDEPEETEEKKVTEEPEPEAEPDVAERDATLTLEENPDQAPKDEGAAGETLPGEGEVPNEEAATAEAAPGETEKTNEGETVTDEQKPTEEGAETEDEKKQREVAHEGDDVPLDFLERGGVLDLGDDSQTGPCPLNSDTIDHSMCPEVCRYRRFVQEEMRIIREMRLAAQKELESQKLAQPAPAPAPDVAAEVRKAIEQINSEWSELREQIAHGRQIIENLPKLVQNQIDQAKAQIEGEVRKMSLEFGCWIARQKEDVQKERVSLDQELLALREKESSYIAFIQDSSRNLSTKVEQQLKETHEECEKLGRAGQEMLDTFERATAERRNLLFDELERQVMGMVKATGEVCNGYQSSLVQRTAAEAQAMNELRALVAQTNAKLDEIGGVAASAAPRSKEALDQLVEANVVQAQVVQRIAEELRRFDADQAESLPGEFGQEVMAKMQSHESRIEFLEKSIGSLVPGLPGVPDMSPASRNRFGFERMRELFEQFEEMERKWMVASHELSTLKEQEKTIADQQASCLDSLRKDWSGLKARIENEFGSEELGSDPPAPLDFGAPPWVGKE